jgi:hypothetical protein
MSGPCIAYVADFAVSMAIDKYAKVPSGHPFGSQLGVNLAVGFPPPLVVRSTSLGPDFPVWKLEIGAGIQFHGGGDPSSLRPNAICIIQLCDNLYLVGGCHDL